MILFLLRLCEATLLQEGLGDHCHQGVMMKTLPRSPLEVIQPKLLFQQLKRIFANSSRLDGGGPSAVRTPTTANRLSADLWSRCANSQFSTWRWPAYLRPRSIEYLARGAYVADPVLWSARTRDRVLVLKLRQRRPVVARKVPRKLLAHRRDLWAARPA